MSRQKIDVNNTYTYKSSQHITTMLRSVTQFKIFQRSYSTSITPARYLQLKTQYCAFQQQQQQDKLSRKQEFLHQNPDIANAKQVFAQAEAVYHSHGSAYLDFMKDNDAKSTIAETEFLNQNPDIQRVIEFDHIWDYHVMYLDNISKIPAWARELFYEKCRQEHESTIQRATSNNYLLCMQKMLKHR